MPIFLIPILILIGIFAVSFGGDFLKNIDIPLPGLQLFSEKSAEKTTPKPASPQPSIIRQTPPDPSPLPEPSPPSFALDTVITAGPEQGAVLAETTEVTFAFEGISTQDIAGRITFETKIEGFDENWKSTSSRQRKITLPPGPKEYTFLVRSKLSGTKDSTPASRTFGISTSPYFGKIDIASVRRSIPFLITLRTNLSSDEKVNISGFTLKSKIGQFSIKRGAEKFYPNITSFNQNIEVRKGDRISISGAQSPFGRDGNFRPNKCFGYLKKHYSFTLSVTSSCPDRPTLQDVSFLAPSCQDFVLKKINLSSCTVPDPSQDLTIARDSECVSYINDHFTYDACSQKHSQDEDFTKNEWHIYTNRSFAHPTHDTIELIDQNGLFVDKKVY